MWKIQSIIVDFDGQNIRYYWIPNFGNAYVIGDDGSIWSRYKGIGKHCYISDEWTRLNPMLDPDGYLRIHLYFNGIICGIRVHRLVCEAEYGLCPMGMEVCHNDNNRSNNNWWNLRYGTREDNQGDRVIHGTDKKGEKSCNAKNTWDEIREIREKYTTGKHTMRDLGLEYGLSQPAIWNIVNNVTWVEESYVA